MTRIRPALLVLAVALLAWALPAAGASAASCTGTPHDADTTVNGNGNEFDVTCDTAITNGGLAIRLNRGGSVASNAQITGGTGALACTLADQAPGSQFDGIISCTGSLSANATAKIFASLGPSPCGPPTFAGDLSVNFGGGVHFGPSALAAYNCAGGGGGGGGDCDKVRSGHACDPGGVLLGVVRKPPKRASVAKARHGLKFRLRLGVKGKAVVTIEVKGKVLGKTTKRIASGKVAKLVAKLSRKGARKLAGHRARAVIHVEVLPNAAAEGFSTHARKYFKLKLTG